MIFFVGSIWESERTAISSVFWRVFVTSSDILFYVRYKGVFGAGRGNSVITSRFCITRNIHQVMFRIKDSSRHVEVFIGRI